MKTLNVITSPDQIKVTVVGRMGIDSKGRVIPNTFGVTKEEVKDKVKKRNAEIATKGCIDVLMKLKNR